MKHCSVRITFAGPAIAAECRGVRTANLKLNVFNLPRRPSRVALPFFFVLIALAVAGCSSGVKTTRSERPNGVPEVPNYLGVLGINVVYPPQGTPIPDVDSNFIFGSIGTGLGTLTINGTSIPVAKNGAFLAFLPMPDDGQYTLIARDSTGMDSMTVSYGPEAADDRVQSHPGSGLGKRKSTVDGFIRLMSGVVVTESDTLATGSDIAPGFQEQGADRKWLFPRGTRLTVSGHSGTDYRIELGPGEKCWVPDTSIRIDSNAAPRREALESLQIFPDFRYVDVKVGCQYAPFYVDASEDEIDLTVYDRVVSRPLIPALKDPLISNVHTENEKGSAHVVIRLASLIWGYKVFYETGGILVLRIRRPPILDPQEPIKGLTIVIDPGHPPGGAIGPTELTEADANLAIAARVAIQLSQKGAHAIMTRTTSAPVASSTNSGVEIRARVSQAINLDADLLISIHNNSFPDGVNPFLNYGTSTFYFHPFSRALAESLDNAILAVTKAPDLGANQKSLALVRPTWMPSALTESLYLMFPDQEAALHDPVFLDQLAAAHVKGIESFLRSRLQKP